MIHVIEVGDTARRSIDGASVASVVAALRHSLYLEVAGEIVWLGPPGSTLHGRAIVTGDPPDVGGATRIETSFDLRAARAWRPHPLDLPIDPAVLARESLRLTGMLHRVGRPDGFGALLIGQRPAFPLEQVAERARRFLEACARNN